jgi:hypothetical protein
MWVFAEFCRFLQGLQDLAEFCRFLQDLAEFCRFCGDFEFEKKFRRSKEL